MTATRKPVSPVEQLARATRQAQRWLDEVKRLSAIVAGGGDGDAMPTLQSRHAAVLDELRRSGCSTLVLKHYLVPVSVIVRAKSAVAMQLFTSIATDMAQYPERLLTLAAAHTLATRTSLTAPKQAMDDAKAVMHRAREKITPADTSEWAAWMVHYRTSGQAPKAQFSENQQQIFELTRYPPGHWENNGHHAKEINHGHVVD